jgi:two-component system nitrate/nitrite sensor histidine kinase NarX
MLGNGYPRQVYKLLVNTLNNPLFQEGSGAGQLFPEETRAASERKPDSGGLSTASEHGDELKMLLDGFLETIIKAVGARAGAIRILSPGGNMLQIVGAVGLPPEVFEYENQVELGCGVCGEAVGDGGIHSVDGAACAWRSGKGFFGGECSSVVAIPLDFRGKLVGVFNLFFKTGKKIADDSAPVLRSFAELIGISLENARLARENRRMNLMAERQAIANEIHDSLAQTLVYGRMRMSMLQEAMRRQDEMLANKCAQDVAEALDTGQKSVRELITHFRCQMDPLGLQHALQVLVDGFRERTEITLEYSNSMSDSGLPSEHELQIFHIVREVLANISTHSGATWARLRAERSGEHCVFSIEDNGAGIPANARMEGHYGLAIMRERAQRIGAEIEVDSTEGQGTCVRLSFSVP